eukprot:scaffold10767_cov65-Cyclotella_meneghiniana.AAC.1
MGFWKLLDLSLRCVIDDGQKGWRGGRGGLKGRDASPGSACALRPEEGERARGERRAMRAEGTISQQPQAREH